MIVNNKTLIIYLLLIPCTFVAKVVEYELTIDYAIVNYTGKNRRAMTINGQIPAPTIQADIGDILRVTFHNHMNVDTSIHWHGILLPNDQDGVPYLTTPPIKAHSSFTYEYPIIHSGTYWYHAHTHFQEERGLYGALVFHAPHDVPTDKDYTVVLSSWIDEHSYTVFKNLKRDGDYYMLKKGTVQSWLGVLLHGSQAIRNRMSLAWMRMGAMDISDIAYDVFLANGKRKSFLHAEPGQQVRLRIINSAAASYFNVEFAGGSMQVVALDGIDIEPFETQRFFIAIAETYDVIITMPEDNHAYELRASAEDGSGYSSVILGSGDVVLASNFEKPNLYLRKFQHRMHKDNKNHKKHMSQAPKQEQMKQAHYSMNSMPQKHSMQNEQHVINNHKQQDIHDPQLDYYQGIRSLYPTSFSSQYPVRELTLRLTGNMERYVWGINNRPLSEVDKILVKKGEVIRFKMVNETMMHHPMHLHGHFFRVLNKQGDYSPLKHTVNVPPMDEVTIEFLASEDKDWFFHCHNLYHMMAGLSRIVSYRDSGECKKNLWSHLTFDRAPFFFTDNSFASNMMFGFMQAWNTRNKLWLEYDFNYKKEFEIDALYWRNFSRYVDVYVGGNFVRAVDDEKTIKLGVCGIKVILPLWLNVGIRVDTKAHVYAEFSSELQLTTRLKFEWEVNTDKEYRTVFSYEISKDFLATIVHDSEFGFGGGIRCRFS